MKERKRKQQIIEVPPEPVLLTLKELAAFLNISVNTVKTWQKAGMPVAINRERILRFDRRACLTWLQQQQ